MKLLKSFSLFLMVMFAFSAPAFAKPLFSKSEMAAIQELDKVVAEIERKKQETKRRRQSTANARKNNKVKPYALIDDDVDKNTLDPEIFGSDPKNIQDNSSPDPQNPEIFMLDADNNIVPTVGRDDMELLEKFKERLR
ncbi:hypothetical protein OO007_17515 [Cocleimonas sp. KMM 6892]|uniref:hypothetical protein n=1 Tax=unclassified Cocleimonas TaxID=2639732 RepID=UPI002DBB9F55|nr:MULTISPECIES: hypothetical protein [unclassified Cocleimonas]MEB8434042.1 hypothetical protein [Cocleimonas sp. KMM 6892]MEC4716853.1 hypothetical protein [Cocleimonas sp. KMM 6895]MEC4745992.1 hypothetical protein [Cocleimonas sp. KMM 6896]